MDTIRQFILSVLRSRVPDYEIYRIVETGYFLIKAYTLLYGPLIKSKGDFFITIDPLIILPLKSYSV